MRYSTGELLGYVTSNFKDKNGNKWGVENNYYKQQIENAFFECDSPEEFLEYLSEKYHWGTLILNAHKEYRWKDMAYRVYFTLKEEHDTSN